VTTDPILQPRIYLDNAATSWPKPTAVYDAIDHYLRNNGAPAGRATYDEAMQVERAVNYCRQQVCNLIGVQQPGQIVFTSNCTESLNLILRGWLKPGDHVITTVTEHNSVLRPLRFLEEQNSIQVTRLACDGQGYVDPDDFRRAITNETRLLVLNHVSNVTGALQPLAEFSRIASEYHVPILLDAAQSLGCLPIDLQATPVAFLAAAGHKSLYGPLGSGLLYVAEEFAESLVPLCFGGTGTQSDQDRQPETMPNKFESGNLNVPAILGLSAGLEFVESKTVATIAATNSELTTRLLEGLAAHKAIKLIGPQASQRRGAVVSFQVNGYDSREIAATLASNFRIQSRSGFHCAPLIHQALHTVAQGGTVRLSPGAFNTLEEISFTLQQVDALITEFF
jgi:cysteine desulfurase family protein